MWMLYKLGYKYCEHVVANWRLGEKFFQFDDHNEDDNSISEVKLDAQDHRALTWGGTSLSISSSVIVL